MGARAKEKEITGEPYTPVLPGDNPRWQPLQMTLDGTGGLLVVQGWKERMSLGQLQALCRSDPSLRRGR